MLPTPVLSVSGKGFARLRISAWHFSPAPPILYAVRAIVYHKSRVLSRVLRDFSGSEAPGTPGAEPARHLFDLPRGRGPSQTPKFLSPGPPSPWLPALPREWRFYRFCVELATPKVHPRRIPQRQVEQVPRGFSSPPPPADTTAASSVSAAGGLMPGMQGAKPLA